MRRVASPVPRRHERRRQSAMGQGLRRVSLLSSASASSSSATSKRASGSSARLQMKQCTAPTAPERARLIGPAARTARVPGCRLIDLRRRVALVAISGRARSPAGGEFLVEALRRVGQRRRAAPAPCSDGRPLPSSPSVPSGQLPGLGANSDCPSRPDPPRCSGAPAPRAGFASSGNRSSSTSAIRACSCWRLDLSRDW